MIKKIFTIIIFTFIAFFMVEKVNAATLTTEKLEGTFYSTYRKNGEDFSATFRMYNFNGKTAYCIEPTIQVTTDIYVAHNGMMKSPYSDEINKRISLIGYYGYDYPGHKTNRYRMATQELIWEATNGIDVKFFTERFFQGDEIDISKEKNEILKLVNNHYIVPSFNRTTIDAVIGTTIEIEDTNKVLSNFEVYSSPNVKVEINNNTLSITPTAIGELSIIFSKKSYTEDQTQVFIGEDPDSQLLGHFGMFDPLNPRLSIRSIGGKVSLEKIDSKTLSFTSISDDATLKGALYGIYNENDERIAEITTTGDSIVTSDYLPSLGTFYLKEEISSVGYELDPTKYYFEITEGELYPKVTVYEKIIEREVELFKVYADGTTTILKGEPNITFEFYFKSSNRLYTSATTDNNGKLSVILPYGTYLIKQKNSTENHEKIDDFEITINSSDDDPLTKLISNAEIVARVKVIKVDENGKKLSIKGIRFKIKDLSTNEYICQTVSYPTEKTYCEFETDENGILITPYPLGSGDYELEEVDQLIYGYLWNEKPLKFSIGDNSIIISNDNFEAIVEVEFSNTEVKGVLEVNKIGEKLVFDEIGFIYEEIKLDGVKYELYAKGNIISQNGTLIFKDGQLVSSFLTENGYYKLDNLYLGSYCLKEISSVENHILDDKNYCFTLEYKDQYTPIVTYSVKLKNYLPKAIIEFTKVDLVDGKPIPNTWIEIYMIYEDEDKLIFSGYTDENGKVIIKDVFLGKGYIIERESADGYQITDKKVYFEITENGQIIKASMSNERIIEVPKTYKTKTYFIEIISILFLITGGISIIYATKNKRK